jgi:hypothetical protein
MVTIGMPSDLTGLSETLDAGMLGETSAIVQVTGKIC